MNLFPDQIGALRIHVKRLAAAVDKTTNRFQSGDPHAKRRRTFQQIYRRRTGGTGHRPAAQLYVERISERIAELSHELERPARVVDIGCGDFGIGKALVEQLPEIAYLGCDIVPELVAQNTAKYANERVRFRTLDAVCDPLPEGDICLVRQVFQHLTNADIQSVLKALRYPVVYVTEAQPLRKFGKPNPDKVVGASVRFDWQTGQGRGVELSQAPFNLPSYEVFRFEAPPNEVLVTEQLILAARPNQKRLSQSATV